MSAMTNPVLADAFAHHSWATVTIIDACRALDAEQLARTMPGTFGPIIDTLRHLVGADGSYLELLSEGRTASIEEDSMDLGELREAAIRFGDVWLSVIAMDVPPDTMITRYREDGSESHAPRGIRLAQVIQHGTDHRSQVCTALTLLGIEPPEIDVWTYAVQDGRMFEVKAPGEAPTT